MLMSGTTFLKKDSLMRRRHACYQQRIRFLAALLLLPGIPAFAYADTPAPLSAAEQAKMESRQALVARMNTMTLSILQDQKKSFAAREDSMKQGINNMVDIPWIARFVLGVAWRQATDAQKTRYTELYRTYLINMYVSNFAQNDTRKVSDMRILGIGYSDKDDYTVRTEVYLSTGERLSVNYLVSDRGDSNKIIDIAIENVSLLTTHRAEFSRIAAAQGVEGVIHRLEQLVEQGAPMEVSQAME